MFSTAWQRDLVERNFRVVPCRPTAAKSFKSNGSGIGSGCASDVYLRLLAVHLHLRLCGSKEGNSNTSSTMLASLSGFRLGFGFGFGYGFGYGFEGPARD
eukprot:1395363-Amorphochlora_amoeboformis.AAC.1